MGARKPTKRLWERQHSLKPWSLTSSANSVMDLQTLLHNIHEDVWCSVCMSPFTDPKILPCFHTFCLHCLNELQRTSGKHGEITCPENTNLCCHLEEKAHLLECLMLLGVWQ